jgi:serine/threonine protein kinase
MHGELQATLRARVLEPGTQLGRYTIVRRIGSGGMAELYLARARGIGGFDKLFALKLVLPHVADDPEFVSMFLDEARLAATLDHANIVHVVDIGRVGDDHFYAMEYVHGLDLRMLARGAPGPLPLEVALTIVLGVAAGLHHAHERCGHDGRPLGIVHRDVSPSNVLVTYDGVVKLVDFGIARAEARSKATQAGVVKGKRGYMSPEQCRGDAVDRRSDVFALGILLWELTVGQRLFAADSDYAVMSKIVFGMVPDPRQIIPAYPPALAEIAMQALQRDADGRPASAQVLAVLLERFVQTEGLRTSSHLLADFIASHFAVEPYPTSAPSVVGVDEDAVTRLGPSRGPRRGRGVIAAIAGIGVLGLSLGAWAIVRAAPWGAAEGSGDASPIAESPNAEPPIAEPNAESPNAASPIAEPPIVVARPPDPSLETMPAALDDPSVEEAPIVVEDEAPSTAPRPTKVRPAAAARPRESPPATTARPTPTTPDAPGGGGAPMPDRPNALFPPRK